MVSGVLEFILFPQYFEVLSGGGLLRSIGLLLTWVLLPFHHSGSAQDLQKFSHEEWTTDDGLPQNTVLCLHQSRDGYLWLGTYEGLVRYNGQEFTVFDKKNLPGLENNTILSLSESADSALLIGTRTGLYRYRAGQILKTPLFDTLSGEFIRTILTDSAGDLWVGTDRGLFRFAAGQVQTIGTRDGMTSLTITSLTEDRAGRLWIGTASGLFIYEKNRLRKAEPNISEKSLYIRTLFTDNENTVWVGASNGLLAFSDGHRIPVHQGLNPEKLNVNSIVQDQRGHLWFGTESGVILWSNLKAGNFSSADGLSNNKIRSLLQDREGTLWIGTNFGLNALKTGRFTVLTSQKGLSDDFVRTIFQDSRKTIWIGTSFGLNQISSGKIRQFHLNDGLPGSEITALAEDESGGILIGTSGNGISLYKNGVFKNQNINHGLLSNTIRAFLPVKDGSVLIGTARGLNLLVNGRIVPFSRETPSKPWFVLSLTHHTENRFWAGTTTGLFLCDFNGSSTEILSPDGNSLGTVFSVYQDKDGNLWAGTDNGLILYRSGKTKIFTVQDGLYNDIAFQILESQDGHFWMTCNKGIYEISRQALIDYTDGKTEKLSCRVYTKSDGLRTSQCNGSSQPAGALLSDGRMMFPTARGVAIADNSETTKANPVPPPVVIEKVLALNESVKMQEILKMAPGKRRFQFHYAALTYIEPEKVRYRYKLEGFDEDWIEAGSRRTAFYTNLPPGDYTFRVLAANSDGVWNQTGASVGLYLEPYYYQTVWFWVIIGSVLVLIFVYFHFSRIRQHQFLGKQLQIQVKERTRELQTEKDRAEEALITAEKATAELNNRTQELENALIRLKQTQFQLIQSEKMISVGHLTAGIAHEINNPINYIFSALSPLRRDVQHLLDSISDLSRQFPESSEVIRQLLYKHDYYEILSEIPVLLNGIEDGARRTEEIVRSLRTYSRVDEEGPKKTDLLFSLENTLFLMKSRIGEGVRILREFDEIDPVDCFPGQMNQVFMNLLANALDAVKGKGEIKLKAWQKKDRVFISLTDSGPGIPEDIQNKIFDPFFSSKEIGTGTGLGLFVAYGVIQAHQGTITFSSEKGQGTTFTLSLPLVYTPVLNPDRKLDASVKLP